MPNTLRKENLTIPGLILVMFYFLPGLCSCGQGKNQGQHQKETKGATSKDSVSSATSAATSKDTGRLNVQTLASAPTAASAPSSTDPASENSNDNASADDEEDGVTESPVPDSISQPVLAALKSNPNIVGETWQVIKTFQADAHIFVVVQSGTGTCSRTYLLLYGEGKIKKCIEVAEECDSELSYWQYGYTRLRVRSDTIFKELRIRQYVTDPKLIRKDGFLKDGHSLDDDHTPTKTDTTVTRITPAFILSDKVPSWPKVNG